MPNRIPQKTRREVIERADRRCELCGQAGGSIHHIIPRRHRNHRAEALILLCGSGHREAEEERDKDSLHQQLKVSLQELYLKYYSRTMAFQLLGGRFYEGEVKRADV
jgi:hypothetical protein